MSKALKVAHEDADALWVSRIREHLLRDEVGVARKLLAEALEHGVAGPDIERLQRLLGAPRMRLVPPVQTTDLSAEYRWFEKNGESYRGQWVALLGEALLAHAETLSEVMAQLKSHPTSQPPLVHYLPPRPVRPAC